MSKNKKNRIIINVRVKDEESRIHEKTIGVGFTFSKIKVGWKVESRDNQFVLWLLN